MNALYFLFPGAALVAALWARRRLSEFVVPEGHYGMLYLHDCYQHRISPGRHRFWSPGYSVTLVDMRPLLLSVPVCGTFTATLTYEIVSPEMALHRAEDYRECLGRALQQAATAVVCEAGADRAADTAEACEQVLALVHRNADRMGIRVLAVRLKAAEKIEVIAAFESEGNGT